MYVTVAAVALDWTDKFSHVVCGNRAIRVLLCCNLQLFDRGKLPKHLFEAIRANVINLVVNPSKFFLFYLRTLYLNVTNQNCLFWFDSSIGPTILRVIIQNIWLTVQVLLRGRFYLHHLLLRNDFREIPYQLSHLQLNRISHHPNNACLLSIRNPILTIC